MVPRTEIKLYAIIIPGRDQFSRKDDRMALMFVNVCGFIGWHQQHRLRRYQHSNKPGIQRRETFPDDEAPV